MKTTLTIAITTAVLGLPLAAQAKDKAEEITASGKVVCAHCDLDVVSKCQRAIKTKDGKAYLLAGEKVARFFKADATKKAKQVKVSGSSTGKVKSYPVIAATKIEEVKTKK